MGESIAFSGILRIYEMSDEQMLDTQFQSWWKRFSLKEKAHEAKLALEAHNLITSAGRTQLLTFSGASATTTAFAQYYAVGTGAIYTVSPSDTGIATELFRAVPASYSVVGNAVTITTNFTSGQAVGTYTNAGLWGVNSTGTANSGTLMTHLLYSYTKGAVAITNDYTITAT